MKRVVPDFCNAGECLKCSPERAGLAGVRVHQDFGIRDALSNVVDLGFDGGQVVLRSALKNEATPERGQARILDHVLPDVLRKHLSQARQKLLSFLKAFFLKIDSLIGVEEYRAAIREFRRKLGAERDVGVLGDGKPQSLAMA